MLLADKIIIVQLIELGQVVIPTGPMIKGSRPYEILDIREIARNTPLSQFVLFFFAV